MIGPDGLRHLGVEKVKPFVTRGVLLDIKRYANGNQTMQPGQEVTLAMVRQTLAAQRMREYDIREGDVVLFVHGVGGEVGQPEQRLLPHSRSWAWPRPGWGSRCRCG